MGAMARRGWARITDSVADIKTAGLAWDELSGTGNGGQAAGQELDGDEAAQALCPRERPLHLLHAGEQAAHLGAQLARFTQVLGDPGEREAPGPELEQVDPEFLQRRHRLGQPGGGLFSRRAEQLDYPLRVAPVARLGAGRTACGPGGVRQQPVHLLEVLPHPFGVGFEAPDHKWQVDRKSTRLNSSYPSI